MTMGGSRKKHRRIKEEGPAARRGCTTNEFTMDRDAGRWDVHSNIFSSLPFIFDVCSRIDHTLAALFNISRAKARERKGGGDACIHIQRKAYTFYRFFRGVLIKHVCTQFFRARRTPRTTPFLF